MSAQPAPNLLVCPVCGKAVLLLPSESPRAIGIYRCPNCDYLTRHPISYGRWLELGQEEESEAER